MLLAAHRDKLFALDPEGLTVRWIFPLPADDDIKISALYGTPAASGQTVLVPTYDDDGDGTLYALNRANGNVRWSFETDGPLVGGVAVEEDVVYFGSSDGDVYALDLSSGEPRWREPFATGDSVWSTPTVVGDTVYVTSLDSRLYALDRETGAERWSFKAGAGIASPAVVNEEAGLVYIGGFDSRLRAVDLGNQQERWAISAHNWFWTRPLVDDGVVYSGSLDSEVYAVDADTGESRWSGPFETRAPVRAAPALVGDSLLIIDRDGNLYSIDPRSGEAAHDRVELGEDVLSDPLLLSSGEQGVQLLVTTTKGDLLRIDPADLRVVERRALDES